MMASVTPNRPAGRRRAIGPPRSLGVGGISLAAHTFGRRLHDRVACSLPPRKAHLCSQGVRAFESLGEAGGTGPTAITAADAHDFYAQGGFPLPLQQFRDPV
jgi:hypothetical protein